VGDYLYDVGRNNEGRADHEFWGALTVMLVIRSLKLPGRKTSRSERWRVLTSGRSGRNRWGEKKNRNAVECKKGGKGRAVYLSGGILRT